MTRIELPPPVVEKVDRYFVVRDDLIAGGTKRRVIEDILTSGAYRYVPRGLMDPKQHADEFVYASPVQGYAQIAIAMGCQALGKKATIFLAKRNMLHPYTQIAKSHGANIVEVPMGFLSNCTAKAMAYAARTGATMLPFGLDCRALHDGLERVCLSIDIRPKEVWCVVGSGTLTRALQRAFPNAEHHAVRVGCRTSPIGNAIEHVAPMPFGRNTKEPPPFPSVPNYDAKAWTFILKHAKPGALFWNVAG